MTPTVRPHVPNVLYHYTCTDHGEAGVKRQGKVVPKLQPMLGYPLAWFTDMDQPDRWSLGLTNATLSCDRTEVRVSVAPHDGLGATTVEPWWYYARRKVDRFIRDLYEDTGLPMHWWVSEKPVRATGMIATSILRGLPAVDHG